MKKGFTGSLSHNIWHFLQKVRAPLLHGACSGTLKIMDIILAGNYSACWINHATFTLSMQDVPIVRIASCTFHDEIGSFSSYSSCFLQLF